MKKLRSCDLTEVKGAVALSADTFEQLIPQMNWDDFSPDLRFNTNTAYKKPFDLAQCFKALANGKTYTCDILSENGRYALEIEISFGAAPLSNTNDFKCHLGVSVPA